MFGLFIKANGDQHELTNQMPKWVVEYDGFDPPQMNLLYQDVYSKDGGLYQQSKAALRNIVLYFQILKNAPENRLLLYEWFRVGHEVELTHGVGDMLKTITGVVETIEAKQFETPGKARQLVQVSILCFDPWLYGTKRTASGTGTATIVYDGDRETGFELTKTFTSSATGITFSVGGEELTLTGMTIQIGDIIKVNTAKHTATCTRSGTTFSILSYWLHGSVWPTLKPGINTVTCAGAFSVSYRPRYQGV